MSIVERARERVNELRTRIEEVRARIRAGQPILGQGMILGQEPLLGQGILPTVQERLREIRARRPLFPSTQASGKQVKGEVADQPSPSGTAMSVEGKPKPKVFIKDISVEM